MARDGWLPQALAKISPDTAVPRLAVICFCVLTVIFAALSFGSLALIQCLTYTGALTLEFLALIVLRIKRADALRAFRVPGGWLGMAFVCITPLSFATLLVYATLRDWRSFPGQMLAVAATVFAGVVLYFAKRNATPSTKG